MQVMNVLVKAPDNKNFRIACLQFIKSIYKDLNDTPDELKKQSFVEKWHLFKLCFVS